MIGFFIKCALALGSLWATVSLFMNGYWGWGIVLILVTAFIGIFFFRHERIILAFYQMRLGNQEKAKGQEFFFVKASRRVDQINSFTNSSCCCNWRA